MAPEHQLSHLFPVGCFLSSSEQLNDSYVVSELDDGGVTLGEDAVMGEEGILEWTEHTPLGSPSAHWLGDWCLIPNSDGLYEEV